MFDEAVGRQTALLEKEISEPKAEASRLGEEIDALSPHISAGRKFRRNFVLVRQTLHPTARRALYPDSSNCGGEKTDKAVPSKAR
jgi:hypothetical protein